MKKWHSALIGILLICFLFSSFWSVNFSHLIPNVQGGYSEFSTLAMYDNEIIIDGTESFPYTLTQPSTLYRLTSDISTAETAFIIAADDVTLDLNGHTVIFDDEPIADLANYGFEQGSGTDALHWDQSGAPAAKRTSEYIGGKGDWVPVETQDYVMKFEAPTVEQYIYSEYFTVEPGEQYVLSVLAYKPLSLKDNYVVEIEGVGQVHDSSWPDLEQWSADSLTFTAPSSSVRVKMGVQGSLAGNTDSLYIDAVEIKKANIDVGEHWRIPDNIFGVALSWGRENVRVTNGSIEQGRGHSYYAIGIGCYGASYYSPAIPSSVDHVVIQLNSSDSYPILIRSARNLRIHDNTILPNDVRRTKYGHDGGTAGIESTYSDNFYIYDNSITGTSSGIKISGRNTNFEIFGNDISIRSNAIHSWSIALAALNNLHSFKIYDNHIDSIQGCGLAFDAWEHHMDGPHDGEIYNNYIEVRDGPQEERGWTTKGIWTRFGVHDLTFENNTVKVYAGLNIPWDGVSSTGIGIRTGSDDPPGGNLRFINNTVEAYSNYNSGSTWVTALSLDSDWGTEVDKYFIGNTFKSNDRLIALSESYGTALGPNVFSGNHLVKADDAFADFSTIDAGWWIRGVAHTTFLDTTSENGADVHDIAFGADGGTFFDINISWSLTIDVDDALGNPLSGAEITITDAEGGSLSVTSGSSGEVTRYLPEIWYYGTCPSSSSPPPSTTYSPYTISVTYDGETQEEIIELNSSSACSFTF